MDNWLALFDGQTRYFLDINDSPVKPDVLRFRGREALSEPFRWDIEFTTRQANIPPEQVLMKYASFRMRSGKNVHGIVTHLESISTSADQSHYRLTLSSRLALLSHTRQCRIFRFQSVPEVVEQVLREHGLEGADFEFQLERGYPDRGLITQWQESDLQFIQRILSEVGIYWRTEMDNTRELDTYIFADSQPGYLFGVRLPYSEPSGLYDGVAESVWDVRTWHRVVTGSVTMRDYNYRTAATPLDATVAVRNDAMTTGEHYFYAAPYRESGDDTDQAPVTESGAFYARLRHERELNKSARIHLFSNASSLTPGQVLEPQGDVISALKDGVIITLATFSASRDSRLHVSVWGMPYTERYCFRPMEIPRPEIHGTLPARIESREKGDTYAYLDEQGRYRVKMDFDREETERGYGYLWLRMAKPYSGDSQGWHTPLTDGTEVAIAYSNGDIDLPYIAYALHDSEHPDPVTRDNHTRNVLRTPANNKLRMEDRRGEEHIKLSTEYGKTQLNTGHLVDAQGKPRGSGTELRTDERGTLRAGKGLFVSADAQAKAQGDVLDMDAALEEIDRLNQQLQQLEMAAEQAQGLKADVDNQKQMFEQRLKQLNEVILLSAPEGMVLTSGEDIQLAATQNVAINAGGDISVGVMGNTTALAGDKLGLFARTGQLSLKSGEGPIDVQAQNASLRLFSEKKLTITSESDISFAGKKRVTLTGGGGSYLKLEAGKVEYGTTATSVRKVKRTMAAGSCSQEVSLAKLPAPSSDINAGSDILLRKPGETETQWAERLVQHKVSARMIEQKTGIPRSRIAKWPSYQKIREQDNQVKLEKTQGKEKAAQLMSEKDIVTHKDLVFISKKTGIPTGTLRRMDEYRARRPEKQKEARIQDKEKAKRLLLENCSVRAIAKKTHVPERTLHTWKGDLKKLKVDEPSRIFEKEDQLIKQITTLKEGANSEVKTAFSVQEKMKKLLNAANDEQDPFVRDRTTIAIGTDGDNKYYISSSSYPVPQKLKLWACSNNISVVDGEGHAEATLIKNVGNIRHVEPSRDVCLECEQLMLKHHVTTSRPFSHKLSQAVRKRKFYTEEERQFGEDLNAEKTIKEKNVAEAKRLLTEGQLSLTDIGQKTGISKSTMVFWREHKTWLASQKQLKAGDPRKAEAIIMSQKGITQNEIAKRLKTSKTKVSQWIKEAKQIKTEFAEPSTSGKRTALHQGLSQTARSHIQSSLRSEIRAESGVVNRQGMTRWLQEPGMNKYSYHDILNVLEDEEVEFDIDDFINAWSSAGRPLPK